MSAERPGDRPRLAPGTRRQVGLANWLISRVSGRVSHTPPPNLFLTLGRHRRLFRGWIHFGGSLMPGGRLPRRDTEIGRASCRERVSKQV